MLLSEFQANSPIASETDSTDQRTWRYHTWMVPLLYTRHAMNDIRMNDIRMNDIRMKNLCCCSLRRTIPVGSTKCTKNQKSDSFPTVVIFRLWYEAKNDCIRILTSFGVRFHGVVPCGTCLSRVHTGNSIQATIQNE